MKFIEVISDTRDTVSIPVSDIKEIHDWCGGNSSVLTVHGEYYYSELSRKQLIEKNRKFVTMSTSDISYIGLKRPVEHNKQPNRIIYFGTDGCVGHYPLGINFTLSKEEYNKIREVDGIITDEVLDENTGTFLRYLSEGVCYTCFGVPYSPDDERPGSKTIVLVENGTVQEVKDAILQNPFLLNKFKKVKEKYELNIDFLEVK